MDLLNMPIGTPTAHSNSVPSPTNATVEPTNVSILATPTTVTPPTVTLSPTLTPSLTPTVALTPTQSADSIQTTVNIPLYPATGHMYGFRYQQQTWNNCGPANITMALSYYGWTDDQTMAAQYLKPGGREDKNVSPEEIVSFVNARTGVRAISRMGGDLNLIKRLIANQFPVLIETVLEAEGYDWIGHYQTIVGYDDAQQFFYIYDSFVSASFDGAEITETYAELDKDWQSFNRTFVVVYQQSRESEVAAILGDLADPLKAAEHALSVAQTEARANPQDAFAWFNLGTSLNKLGRYDEAAVAFDRARQLELPFRMLWYQFGPFETYYNIGRYDDVLSLASANITSSSGYIEEMYYWQGLTYLKRGMTAEAASAFRTALNRNPDYVEAKTALDSMS
jgi:tetratricopeptide (TPR) repeat protein